MSVFLSSVPTLFHRQTTARFTVKKSDRAVERESREREALFGEKESDRPKKKRRANCSRDVKRHLTL